MGTNYYLHRDLCPHCKRSGEPLHIGKSSAGWCFALHVIPEDGINDLDDWRELWNEQGVGIRDECGDEITISRMEAIITERSWPSDSHRDADWYETNYSAPGPKCLARHRYNATPGEGTWDLCHGEFS